MRRIAADWLNAPGTQAVLRLLEAGGHEAYLVGGCVRNELLDMPVHDIDIASSATPEDVIALCEDAGLRTVPTGIDHGTVTVLSGQPHEVTTFRNDVETDGRRAVVAFGSSLAEDAARRDFTMNALYANADGEVLDPTGEGLADLDARVVRFIGRPARRIEEDGLRVLRFFRFSAIYGRPGAPLDPAGLAAVTELRDALRPVSRERIGAEMRKLLGAPHPGVAVADMVRSGILAEIAPESDGDGLPPLLKVERVAGATPRWQRRLVALGPVDWAAALRLSRSEAREVQETEAARWMELPPHALAERFGPLVAEDAVLLAWAATGTPPPDRWREDIALGAQAEFPLSGRDLAGRYPPGPEMGAALERLRQAWVESRFTLDRAVLLAIDSDGAI